VRADCTGCGESKGLVLQEIEGGSGAIKAETCDTCHGYAKVLYQANDPAVDPMADDLTTLGVDLAVSKAGWSRLPPDPLVMAPS
jgi:FdhE protein